MTGVSKSIQTVEMEFISEAGNGWDRLSAEKAVEMMSHLPPASIEGLRIDFALWTSLYGCSD